MRTFIFNIVFGAFEGILIYLLTHNSFIYFIFDFGSFSPPQSSAKSQQKKALFLENRALWIDPSSRFL